MPRIPHSYGENETESASLRCIHVTNLLCSIVVIGIIFFTGTHSTLLYMS